mgnify:CR=1 FL=1
MAKNHFDLNDYLNSEAVIHCEKCKDEISQKKLAKNFFICPFCQKYNRVPARVRIEYITEKDSFKELFDDVPFYNPLQFPDYENKVQVAKEKSGEDEGVICGLGKIGNHDVALFVMESKFMMGSMGTVIGDKITALFEYATQNKMPVIGYSVSGGARMQEGALSLMQMAKVSAAVKKHSDEGLFYLLCASDPTTGGVTASFAMLGDVIISEPESLIGFAGKRVIEQVTGEVLPDTFQSAEFQLEHGFIDDIVERKNHYRYLKKMLDLNERE